MQSNNNVVGSARPYYNPPELSRRRKFKFKDMILYFQVKSPGLNKYVGVVGTQHTLTDQLLRDGNSLLVGDAQVTQVVQETGLPIFHILSDKTCR